MNSLKSYLKEWHQGWNQFWFEKDLLFQVGLFRVVFCSILLLMYCIRFKFVEDYYFNTGFLSHEIALKFYPPDVRPLFAFFFQSDQMIYLAHVLLLLGILLLILGVLGRNLTWVVFILHLIFIQRNRQIVYGADIFATFWLFYLCMIRHNVYFSVINFIKKNRSKANDIMSSMGCRFIQIQICAAYTFTGLEKLKGFTWWEGSAIWYVMGNSQMAIVDFSFLKYLPSLVAIVTFTTLIFEIYFIFAIWTKRLRPLWLLIGFGMHLSIALSMHLYYFSSIMASVYILFLEKEGLVKGLQSLFQRLGFRHKQHW